MWGTTGDAGSQKFQRTECLRSADTVGGDPDFTLERRERFVGLRAEETVDPTCVEAEVLQFGLQSCDVVAVQRRRKLVNQRTGAQAVRGLAK